MCIMATPLGHENASLLSIVVRHVHVVFSFGDRAKDTLALGFDVARLKNCFGYCHTMYDKLD